MSAPKEQETAAAGQQDDTAALPDIADATSAFSHVPEHGFSLFLSKRTKTIHFIRHAEGMHNEANAVAGNDSPVTFSTPGAWNYIDAKLTKKGVGQCIDVRDRLLNGVKPEVIFVSPFTRTLQTAHIIFGGRGIPFYVHELLRERSGKYCCDKRRTRDEIVRDVGPMYERTQDNIDFDRFGYPQADDIYWTEGRESDESVTNRGIEFLEWLATRPETEIAVVSHASFLRHLFSEFGENVTSKDRNTLQHLAGNAEVRSVCLALHKGFYPDGKWEEDEFVPADESFRRGKWAPGKESISQMHNTLREKTQLGH